MSKQSNQGEFVSEAGFKTLEPGRHLCRVTNIGDDISKSNGTKQLVVSLEAVDSDRKPTGQGSVRKWFNLEGWEHDPNNPGEFLLDDDDNLITSKENTAACKRIVGQFANRCGIPAGESFNRGDLIGKSIGVIIKISSTGSTEVSNFVEFDKLAAKLNATQEAYAG